MTTTGEVQETAALPRPAGRRSVARSSATVATWTLISRLSGLLRIVVVGAVLGPTFLANTFLATNQVPNLTYSAVAGPVLALVVVPTVVRTLVRDGLAASGLHVRRISGLLLTASGAVALLLVPASLVLSWALTAGIPEPERGRARGIAIVLLLLVAPQIVLYTFVALGAAAQQARRRFALAAGAPALENVGLMVTMAAVAVLMRPGTDIGDVSYGMVFLLGGGATASVAVHAAVQAFGAHRVGLSLRPAGGWRRDPEMRAVLRRLKQSAVVAAAPSAAFFLLLACAATMRGGVLVFQMAYLVYGVPTALGARAVTTAVLPGMSEAAQAADRPRFAAAWRQALSYVWIAGLPALAVLVILARPIAGALSTGQLRQSGAMTALAVCIAIMGIAQLSSGLHELGRQALFARLDSRGPQLSAGAGFVVTAISAGAALLLPAGLPRLAGLCTAMLLADTASATVAAILVRRTIRPERALDGHRLGRAAAAGAAMVPVLAAGLLLVDRWAGWLSQAVVVTTTAVLATAVFALVLRRGTRSAIA